MSTQKFITIDSTGKKILRGAVDTSLGSADSGKIVGLNVDGKVDISMIPTSVGKVGCIFALSEPLSAGDWVNVFTDGTDYKARLADVTDSAKVCHGFTTANGIAGDSEITKRSGTGIIVRQVCHNKIYFSAGTHIHTGRGYGHRHIVVYAYKISLEIIVSSTGEIQFGFGTDGTNRFIESHIIGFVRRYNGSRGFFSGSDGRGGRGAIIPLHRIGMIR